MIAEIYSSGQELRVRVCHSSMPVAKRALQVLSDALRHRRSVLAYANKGDGIGVLAAAAPTLDEVLDMARCKAFVVLGGTLISIDRVGMASIPIECTCKLCTGVANFST